MVPITDADAPAAALTRIVARDELADMVARLDVIREELARNSPAHAVASALAFQALRGAMSSAVRFLTLSIDPAAPLPSCACGHGAHAHALDVDATMAWVMCKVCGCSIWEAT